MKLDDIKDGHGTSIQSYADTLIEKCQETGTVGVIILANEELFLITNIGDTPNTTIRTMTMNITPKSD